MWSPVSRFRINTVKNCRKEGSEEVHIDLLVNSSASLSCVNRDRPLISKD